MDRHQTGALGEHGVTTPQAGFPVSDRDNRYFRWVIVEDQPGKTPANSLLATQVERKIMQFQIIRSSTC